MNKTSISPFPEPIRTVSVTAPAGPPDDEKLSQELQFLRKFVRVKEYLPSAQHDAEPYLAGSAEERLDLFNQAVGDPETDLIIAARGGFGCMHILPGIDYTTLQQRQIPVMGYSDITALHCAMLSKNAGVPIAGTNLIGLHDTAADAYSCMTHRAALTQNGSTKLPEAPQKLTQLYANDQLKMVTAPAYAANLTVLSALCGTEFMPDFAGYILILEDVNEPLYKIDRMLTQLHLAGVFRNLKALVVGCFTGDAASSAVAGLFRNMAAMNSIPAYSNFQFGHVPVKCAVNARKNLTVSDGHDPEFS